MLKRFILLLYLMGVGQVLTPSCTPLCECPDVPDYLKLEQISAVTIGKSGTIYSGGNAQLNDLAGIRLDFTGSYYGFLKKRTGNLFAQAYACDCVPPGNLGTQETIKNIQVKTLNKFGFNYPAGSLLNAEITYLDPRDAQRKPLSTIQQSGQYIIHSFEPLFLEFSKSPEAGDFSVEITIELTNGQKFVAQSPVVQLK